ncbi:MAG: hypothetical protein ABI874_13790 [Chloroflexota bacterium]
MSNSIESSQFDKRQVAKEELRIHYDQLQSLDDHIYRYSSVFFTINAALLAFLAQLLNNDKRALDPLIFLFIGFLGYTSALCVFLIAWKGYYAWEMQAERVRVLEAELGYHISDWNHHSRTYKRHWPARHLSISKIRWIFNLLLAVMWGVLILFFPRLSDVSNVPLFVCLYPILIPLLVAIPLGIAFAPALITEILKGRHTDE